MYLLIAAVKARGSGSCHKKITLSLDMLRSISIALTCGNDIVALNIIGVEYIFSETCCGDLWSAASVASNVFSHSLYESPPACPMIRKFLTLAAWGHLSRKVLVINSTLGSCFKLLAAFRLSTIPAVFKHETSIFWLKIRYYDLMQINVLIVRLVFTLPK